MTRMSKCVPPHAGTRGAFSSAGMLSSTQSPSIGALHHPYQGPPEARPSGRALEAADFSASAASGVRCAEKGCVFPAAVGPGGICLYHERERREPGCFHSRQPSQLLLERAKFGLLVSDYEEARARDRKLWRWLREMPEEIA